LAERCTGCENLTGSAFNDTLTGDGNANVIEGLAGNDTLSGGLGTDTLSYEHATAAVTVSIATTSAQNTGGAGTDTCSSFENLTGSAFNDTLTGWTNNNVIEGLAGNDTMNGGAGTDTVDYEHATAAVTVSLATTSAQNTGGAGTDTISNFENLTGSAFNDSLTGDSNANTITGGSGNDTITGGGGADNLYGGTGADTFLFLAATALGTSVNIQDFTNGAGNDKIDIKDVISGYDPATMAITDWVQITTVGSDSVVKVDIDGTGTGHTWQQIATIVGVTGLTDEAALVASGNLIAH
jgi:Ca2+-binding RTX toxin-like protein